MQIKDFRINPAKDSLKNIESIKNCIDEFASCSDLKDLNNSFANLLSIPIDVINKKVKQIIYKNFDYYDKNPKFKIDFFFFKSLKIFFLFFFLIIFKTKIKPKLYGKKINIILDNVEKNYVIEKFSKTLSYFDTSLVLYNKTLFKNINFKNRFKNKLIFFNVRSFFLSNDILFGKTFKFLFLIIKLFFLSKKTDVDLIQIYFKIFYTSLKYYRIFNLFNSKLLIHDRIYDSCPIRNYLFKKIRGGNIFCLQSHLAEGTISVFSDIDILVTFGKENDTKKKLELLGGKINYNIVCGSIRMEQALHNNLKKYDIEEIDILLIGINLAHWIGTSRSIKDIYYKHFEWIAKISKKYPKLKITIKHHPNYRDDKIENEITKSTNIKTIINSSQNLNSYHFLLKSKLVLSFGSTMILEGLGFGRECFFLDPGSKNTTFFNNLDYIKDKRITSFEGLDNLVKDYFLYNKPIPNLNNEKICLTHKNSSRNLFMKLTKNKL